MRFSPLTALASVLLLSQSALAAEMVPVCPKCLNPRVTFKTGVGSAAAALEAKVVLEDATAWCAINRPRDKYCSTFEVKQGGDGNRDFFRAKANCASGEMNAINGGDYKYAGVWPDGPGQGRAMLKGAMAGNIPGWDKPERNGQLRDDWDRNGGYSLTGQWEMLCGKTAPSLQSTSAPARQVAKPAAPPAVQSEKEWLSLCGKCENPTVFAKSGIGTANAVAQARMDGAGGKVYRASANCASGRITTIEGNAFTLAGVWDSSDIGAGRSKWRGSDGKIQGRDNASNGLATAQQWEVLCPAPLSPALLAQAAGGGATPPAANSVAAQVARPQNPGLASAAPQVPAACTGKRYCSEVSSFAAIITDFRPSIYDNSTRIVTATVRFLNKTARPLTLGYVRTAGVAVDEQGNRYVLPSAESVRGIAEITAGREFDPKFTVLPGQTSDARFEFSWKWNGRDIIGQAAWDVELTIREVNEVAPGQYRFGQEHALQFKAVPGRNTAAAPGALPGAAAGPLSIATPPVGAAPQAGGIAPPVSAPAVLVPPQEPDACVGKTRCYDAGPFVAEIVQASLTREGNFQDRVVRVNVRFRNKSNQPMALAYVARTSVLSDNLGNRFEWGSGYDNSATGIGKVESNKADPQFVLRPGEARAATFTLFRRRPARTAPDGTGYTYGVTLAELEILSNGQQIRTAREHTLTFADFGLNGPGANPFPAGGTQASPATIKQTTEALKDIFKKKK